LLEISDVNYYVDLTNILNINDVKILNQNLNETLKNLTIKNDENEKLLQNKRFKFKFNKFNFRFKHYK
jgi:hypothetical protein